MKDAGRKVYKLNKELCQRIQKKKERIRELKTVLTNLKGKGEHKIENEQPPEKEEKVQEVQE